MSGTLERVDWNAEFVRGDRSRFYTGYHHRGQRGNTDESVTERAFPVVRFPLGGGPDSAAARHLVQLEDC